MKFFEEYTKNDIENLFAYEDTMKGILLESSGIKKFGETARKELTYIQNKLKKIYVVPTGN